jgi:hypothetical protein
MDPGTSVWLDYFGCRHGASEQDPLTATQIGAPALCQLLCGPGEQAQLLRCRRNRAPLGALGSPVAGATRRMTAGLHALFLQENQRLPAFLPGL